MRVSTLYSTLRMTRLVWQMPQLRRNLVGGRLADKREARFEKVRGILEYEVPLVRMVDYSFDDAVDAFTRINTLGEHRGVTAIQILGGLVERHHLRFIRGQPGCSGLAGGTFLGFARAHR